MENLNEEEIIKECIKLAENKHLNKNYISKDKIKEIKQELECLYNQEHIQNYNKNYAGQLKYAIQILEELLEE